MKLVFIGSGSAFTVGEKNYHSNMLLIPPESDAKLLIDCGSDARHALHDLGFNHTDITDVYISHLHADHAGGLEWLALSSKFTPHGRKPNLYANKAIIDSLWGSSLSGGLSTLQGEKTGLNSFFELYPIQSNDFFVWHNINFQTVQTLHIMNGYAFMPSFGLLFTINNTRIFITTDTQFVLPQLMAIYAQADIIFQDCETEKKPSGVHAHFNQLMTLDESIKNKMWLYHYQSSCLPDAEKHGFCGFVQRGQTFSFA